MMCNVRSIRAPKQSRDKDQADNSGCNEIEGTTDHTDLSGLLGHWRGVESPTSGTCLVETDNGEYSFRYLEMGLQVRFELQACFSARYLSLDSDSPSHAETPSMVQTSSENTPCLSGFQRTNDVPNIRSMPRFETRVKELCLNFRCCFTQESMNWCVSHSEWK